MLSDIIYISLNIFWQCFHVSMNRAAFLKKLLNGVPRYGYATIYLASSEEDVFQVQDLNSLSFAAKINLVAKPELWGSGFLYGCDCLI